MHRVISGYYQRQRPWTQGKSVRDWMAGRSMNEQFEVGMQILTRDFEMRIVPQRSAIDSNVETLVVTNLDDVARRLPEILKKLYGGQ